MNLTTGLKFRQLTQISNRHDVCQFCHGADSESDISLVGWRICSLNCIFMKKAAWAGYSGNGANARAARVLGINTDRIYAFTFSLNAAICGVAGVLVSMIWVLQLLYGIVYSLRPLRL